MLRVRVEVGAHVFIEVLPLCFVGVLIRVSSLVGLYFSYHARVNIE